jgi:sugar/nucleoside kinase (ribokinase family)
LVKKRLGVIGSFVWDEIHGRDSRERPVEEWGGITYSLGGLDASVGPDWEIVPIVKVGSDLAQRAREYLHSLDNIAADAAPIEVSHQSNRVALHYLTDERRSERLIGGIPGWNWSGLKPLLRDIDALYVNLISGFEIDLETAQLIRQHFRGPIYFDLHSLLLSIQPDGVRKLVPLPNPQAWCRCSDFLQVNEEEMEMMAHDSMELAAMAMANGVKSLVVTLGKRGVVYFAAAGFNSLADLKQETIARPGGASRTALLPAHRARTPEGGDPTGCGDVWGATYFSRLLAGDNLDTAMSRALEAAARNVDHRGATGLADYLRGELSLK